MMVRTRQKVDVQGIYIPLPFVEQYGLLPGAEVIVEFGPDGIFLAPARLSAEKVEIQALRLLFRKVGDAIKVKIYPESDTEKKGDGWRVDVYGSDGTLLLGYLFYTADGEMITERSTSFDAMRQKAMEFVAV